MSRRTLFAVALLATLPAAATEGPEPSEDVDAANAEIARARADLKWARDMNGEAYAPPPSEFRPGHVGPHTLPDSAISRTQGRFVVQFPSGAPVVSPAVHDGKVFASGGFQGKELYAFDARAGTLSWAKTLNDDGPSAPACEAGVCVLNTESCTVFAVAADSGQHLWSWWMGDPMLAAPAVANGKVFTSYPAAYNVQSNKPAPPGGSHAIAALDLKTGRVLWQRWIDGDVMSSPVAVDGEVLFTTFSGTVYTLAQADGEIRAVERGRATSAPTVVAGSMYLSTRTEASGESAREALVAKHRATGRTTSTSNEKAAPYIDGSVQSGTGYGAGGASLDAGNGFASMPATANAGEAAKIVGQASVSRLQSHQGSRVVSAGQDNNVSTMGDELVSTDPGTGEVRWRYKVEGDLDTGGFMATPPAVAGDKLVIGTTSGKVVVLNAEDGQVVHTYAVGGPVRAQPVVDGGWIYVGTENGQLIGIDTGDPSLTGWGQWGGNAARTGTVTPKS